MNNSGEVAGTANIFPRSTFRKHLQALIAIILTTLSGMLSGCETVTENRIPSLPVHIDLSNQGLWNAYGVSGFGSFNYFVFQSGSAIEPSGFSYKSSSATGYGGVLLIEGVNPFEMDAQTVPLAYDLSCPVERSRTIRVRIDPTTYDAVCPVCDSHYDVTGAAGAPVAGPAVQHKYGLRRYYCHKTSLNGYIINDTK